MHSERADKPIGTERFLKKMCGVIALLMLEWVATAPLHGVEIYFYQRGYIPGGAGAATQLTDAAVAAFEADHPEVDVRVVGVPWGREGDLKLRTALLARRRIDVFRLAHDQLPAFIPREGRLLSAIDPYLTAADREALGPALEAVQYGGEALAWPLWSTAISLIAQPQILEAHGIEPPADRPWSWEEFTRVLERLKGATHEGEPIHGLNAAARPPLFEWSPLLMAHCGPLFTGNEPAADGSLPLTPELARALGKVREWREAGLLAPSFGIDDNFAVQQAFLDGRLAFVLSSPGFIRRLVETETPYRILAPPSGEYGRPITTGALGCFAVVESEPAERVDAAHALARFLTSREIAQEVEGWYLAPPARATVTSFYEQPAYRALQPILPHVRYLVPPTRPGFMESIFIPRLQGALLGQLTPEEAIEQIQAAARRQALR